MIDKNKDIVVAVCKEVGANIPLMLAIAHIETGGKFNADAGKGKTFVGLYQLSNGYGGCKGDERLDVRKSTLCTWKQIENNKQNFIKEFGYWEDWFAYGIHQQGLSGFKYLLENRDKRVTAIDKARQDRITSNIPKSLTVTYVRDFLDYWKNRINGLMDTYKGGSEVFVSNKTTSPLDIKNLLLPAISIVLVAGTIYIIKKRAK
jgi:hypothetical protein